MLAAEPAHFLPALPVLEALESGFFSQTPFHELLGGFDDDNESCLCRQLGHLADDAFVHSTFGQVPGREIQAVHAQLSMWRYWKQELLRIFQQSSRPVRVRSVGEKVVLFARPVA
jgi:hypothetical protein